MYIIIVIILLVALLLWFRSEMKNVKRKERYTKDEDRKKLWDSDKLLEPLKDAEPTANISKPEKKSKIKEKKEPAKKPVQTHHHPETNKTSQDLFNLKQGMIASEILKRKYDKH